MGQAESKADTTNVPTLANTTRPRLMDTEVGNCAEEQPPKVLPKVDSDNITTDDADEDRQSSSSASYKSLRSDGQSSCLNEESSDECEEFENFVNNRHNVPPSANLQTTTKYQWGSQENLPQSFPLDHIEDTKPFADTEQRARPLPAIRDSNKYKTFTARSNLPTVDDDLQRAFEKQTDNREGQGLLEKKHAIKKKFDKKNLETLAL